MKPAKRTVHPLALAGAVFVAVVLALAFTLGRQPPGATVGDATDNAAAPVAVDEAAEAKTAAQADAKAQADAEKRRRRITNQIINTAIGVSVLQ